MLEYGQLFSHFTNAPLVVRLICLSLFFMSTLMWAMTIYSAVELYYSSQKLRKFESFFWSGKGLDQYYQRLSKSHKDGLSGIDAIFYSGYHALLQQSKQESSQPKSSKPCQEAMSIMQTRLSIKAYSKLQWLATIATISPYVGLLGTVFGVMHTFQGLLTSATQNSLNAVAPGISEALATTALGLFVAIPAVIAYNRLSLHLDNLFISYEVFQKEFLQLANQEMN